MLKRLIKIAVASCIVLIFTSVSSASEVGGKVIAVFDRIALLDVGGGKTEVIIAKKDAVLKNFTMQDIETCRHLKARYEEEAGAVKLAYEIEADPVIEPEPSLSISAADVRQLVKSRGDYMLIDSRPVSQYEAGYIPTAVSMPDAEFSLDRLPAQKDMVIIFYSEDKRDPSSIESAKKTIVLGYTNVRVMSGGLQAWLLTNSHTLTTVQYVKRQISEDRPLVMIDTRPAEKIKSGHIPGAFHVLPDELNRRRIMPQRTVADPIVFYGEDDSDEGAQKAAEQTLTYAYAWFSHAPVNVLKGGFAGWKAEGLSIAEGDMATTVIYSPRPSLGIISVEEFKEIWAKEGKDKVLLDVRQEVAGPVAKFVVNIPIDKLPFQVSGLPKEKEIIVFCSAGKRAKIAYYMLKNIGYRVRYFNGRPPINADGTLQ